MKDKRQFQGKFLALRIATTLLILLFVTLPYFSSVSNNVSVILMAATLIIFFTLDSLFRKNSIKSE